MEEPFDLPVTYKGKELLFPAQLLFQGYTHKFQVDVNGLIINFEPDEERAYRATIDPLILEKNRTIDTELLKAIAEAISSQKDIS